MSASNLATVARSSGHPTAGSAAADASDGATGHGVPGIGRL